MTLADTRFSNRRRKLATAMAAERLDDFLVTHLIHVRYLSGFSGSNGAVLLSKDQSAAIATDGRYATQIAEEVPDITATITSAITKDLLQKLEGPRRVGVESDFVSIEQFKQMEKQCPEEVTLVPVSGMIEKIRLIKDNVEIERLTGVAELASQALEDMIAAGEIVAGRTERQIAADLEYRMRLLGAERPSFDTIVASGPNGAKPHHGAGDRELQEGDLVTIDYGAHRAGFNSDMTRTVAVGKIDDFSREIYDIVLKAQEAGVRAATPGTPLADIDAACRDIIREAGYEEYFVHSTGHGIGLDVHEAPAAAHTGQGKLEAGMTLTIEPGIYIPGKVGVRIEDTLVITDGKPRNLSTPTKQLREL